MRVKLDPGAYLPERAHTTDAGLDIRLPHGGLVRAGQSRTFATGVHVELPEGTVGLLLPKSGLMVGHDILCFGVVDEGYSGQIMAHVFNHGPNDYEFAAGDKVTQLVVVPCRYEAVEIVGEISGGERRGAGFGSTGK